MLAGCAEIVSTMDLLSWNDVTSATDEANGIQTYWKREQANEFTEIVWLTTVPKNRTKDVATLSSDTRVNPTNDTRNDPFFVIKK